MSTSHHGSNADPVNPEMDRIIKRLMQQLDGTARREYPAGRMGYKDDGALSYAITTDHAHKVVVIRFGKPVEWIGLGAKECVQLAENLIARAKEIATESLQVSI